MTFISRLKYLIRYSKEELYEFYSATIPIIWGLFQFFPQRSAFNVTNHVILNLFFPQQYFGIVALFIGIGYMIGIFGEFDTPKRVFNLMLVAFWSYVTILYFGNNYTSTSVVVYGSYSIFNCLTFLRQ